MQVRATASIVGHGFVIDEGQRLDQDEFAAKVGEGWKALCVPDEATVERAVRPRAPERRRGAVNE